LQQRASARKCKSERFTRENIWVKRPGTGEIKAKYFDDVIGKTSIKDIPANTQLKWSDFK